MRKLDLCPGECDAKRRIEELEEAIEGLPAVDHGDHVQVARDAAGRIAKLERLLAEALTLCERLHPVDVTPAEIRSQHKQAARIRAQEAE